MINNLIAETLGTFIFFTCILVYGEPIPVAIGLLAAIYAFGKVSGGHFNSTVSFMKFVNGDIDLQTFILYVVAQMIGALVALVIWKQLYQEAGDKRK
jgi:aquaporin Z